MRGAVLCCPEDVRFEEPAAPAIIKLTDCRSTRVRFGVSNSTEDKMQSQIRKQRPSRLRLSGPDARAKARPPRSPGMAVRMKNSSANCRHG